ncbi:MAG: sporulation peptidase YabG [Bacilli bacterium]
MFKIGDTVTRKSYNNDIVFIITDYEDDTYYLKGKNIRLFADALEDDLLIAENIKDEFAQQIERINSLDRNNYFYLPGKILHIDGDNDYLKKCLSFYKENNLQAIGKIEKEEEVPNNIEEWIKEYRPNIVVITGHDAYYKKKRNNENYKNTNNFIKSIEAARRLVRNQDELIIIAGACQSNYEELICAGANFASSPKRINIHALDPAIIASSMAYAECNKQIDIKSILERTKYGSDGIGGIITKGTMHVGYPR